MDKPRALSLPQVPQFQAAEDLASPTSSVDSADYLEAGLMASNLRKSRRWKSRWNKAMSASLREFMGDEFLEDRRRGSLSRRRICKCVQRVALRLFLLMIFGLLVTLGLVTVVKFFLHLATFVWTNDVQYTVATWGLPGTAGADLSYYPTSFSRDIIPIGCHSHNDYWRRVPLYQAIDAGCIGVEADVHLVNNELYVGHNAASLTQNRTLRNMYINPLVNILDKQNPHTEFANVTGYGVFDEKPEQTLVLLIDFKTDGAETWPVVSEQLDAFRQRDWLSYWDGQHVVSRPITVVATGNAPFFSVVANTTYRDIFFDAPLDQMWEPPSPTSINKDTRDGQATYNPTNSYYASVSFHKTIGSVWRGLSSHQMDRIRGHIRGAHQLGLKARFWDLPSWPVGLRDHVWNVLIDEGVDLLNVDDLAGMKKVWR